MDTYSTHTIADIQLLELHRPVQQIFVAVLTPYLPLHLDTSF